MSRYRSYGKAPGARTYLTRREEFTMSDAEKDEAFVRRKKAAEAAAQKKVFSPPPPKPMWPSAMSIQRWRAHGTPIPPPPNDYAGPIPEQYAAHIAWPTDAAPVMVAEESEEHEEEADAPRM